MKKNLIREGEEKNIEKNFGPIIEVEQINEGDKMT